MMLWRINNPCMVCCCLLCYSTQLDRFLRHSMRTTETVLWHYIRKHHNWFDNNDLLTHPPGKEERKSAANAAWLNKEASASR